MIQEKKIIKTNLLLFLTDSLKCFRKAKPSPIPRIGATIKSKITHSGISCIFFNLKLLKTSLLQISSKYFKFPNVFDKN